MARKLLALGLCLQMLAGCCASSRLNLESDDLADLEQANRRFAGKTATIRTATGTEIKAKDVHLNPEAISWSTGEERVSLPASDVASVQVTWRGSAARKSVLFSLVVGGIAGGLSYAANYDDPDNWTPEAGLIAFPILFMVTSVPIASSNACRTYYLDAGAP